MCSCFFVNGQKPSNWMERADIYEATIDEESLDAYIAKILI